MITPRFVAIMATGDSYKKTMALGEDGVVYEWSSVEQNVPDGTPGHLRYQYRHMEWLPLLNPVTL